MHFRYYLEPASPLKSLTGSAKIINDAQNYNSTISKPVSGRTPALNNTSVTSPYSAPNNFPTKFVSDNNAIAKIQAPNIKTNGQTNGATRTNILPRNLNNNVTLASDSDFVADFSTAIIFNGATYTNNNSTSKISKTDNSYSMAQNGTNLSENDNFADFEHNPIFNAGKFFCRLNFIPEIS